MEDMTHDHLTFGFQAGCPGCVQTLQGFAPISQAEADFLASIPDEELPTARILRLAGVTP